MSVVVDLALTGVKIAVGLLFNSRAILADGLHSGSDVVTDVAVLAGLRMSDRPADLDHHYGHRRISTMVGMFLGASLMGAGVWIAYGAIVAIRTPVGAVRGLWPLCVAAGSIPIKELLFQVTRRVGRRVGNVSVLANAWHHRTDAFTSLAAAAGLAGVAFGGPEWRFLDPVAALVLAAFLLVVAVGIVKKSGAELIDRAPAAATLSAIRQVVTETDGVRGYHGFRARRVGGKIEMDVHVQVEPDLTVAEGHDIATAVRERVGRAEPNVVEVIVHVEPAGAEPGRREIEKG